MRWSTRSFFSDNVSVRHLIHSQVSTSLLTRLLGQWDTTDVISSNGEIGSLTNTPRDRKIRKREKERLTGRAKRSGDEKVGSGTWTETGLGEPDFCIPFPSQTRSRGSRS